MKDYTTKLAENERATKRWETRLRRASNKLNKLGKQKLWLMRAQSKAWSAAADAAEKGVPEPEEKKKPVKRGKPERRINL